MGAKTLSLSVIRTDGGTQLRTELQRDVIDEYRALWLANVPLPPIVVFFDGDQYWLADGFHRLHGALAAERDSIPCDIREGTVRDARLHAAGANAGHGLRRTNADKRKAVESLLSDDEWSSWSNRRIAEACHVTHTFVNHIRSEVETDSTCERRFGKDGKSYGKPPTRREPPPQPDEEDKDHRELLNGHGADTDEEQPVSPPPPPDRATLRGKANDLVGQLVRIIGDICGVEDRLNAGLLRDSLNPVNYALQDLRRCGSFKPFATLARSLDALEEAIKSLAEHYPPRRADDLQSSIDTLRTDLAAWRATTSREAGRS